MADIFQEVDEEVRRDKTLEQARKYAPWVVAGMIAIIAVVGGLNYWRHYQQSQRLAASEKFIAAMELVSRGERDNAAKAFAEMAATAAEPYATMARLREGGLKAEGGDRIAAIAVFDELANKAPDQDMRELARLMAAAQALEAQGPDAGIARLEPLAQGSGAWRGLAREYLALAQLQKGDLAKARATLDGIANDKELSAGQRERARELLAAIPADAK